MNNRKTVVGYFYGGKIDVLEWALEHNMMLFDAKQELRKLHPDIIYMVEHIF